MLRSLISTTLIVTGLMLFVNPHNTWWGGIALVLMLSGFDVRYIRRE